MPFLSRLRAWITAADVADDEAEDETFMFDQGPLKVVVGLGNPGRKYANTRHNLGFLVVEELARRTSAPTSRQRMKAEITETRFDAGRLVLAMPQTYMNDSGVSVREIVRWYKTPLEDVLVVVDDLDLRYGQIRLRPQGSPGGHNGLKSVFRELGTQDVPRLRVGIGRGHGRETINHVLSRFSPEEEQHLPEVIARAADAAELWLREGILVAMNEVNASSPV
jgi:PTH1 family peptidyl-tRNA hydrolase